MPSIFLSDMYGLFFWKTRTDLVLLIHLSILNNSDKKPNKIWVDQGSGFYNSYFKKWLKGNGIDMQSTYNEGKSVVSERIIRTLKNKIFKHMTTVSKNVYFDVLDDIVGDYNNTYHRTI